MFPFSAISEHDSCLSCFLIPKITSASLAPYRNLKGPEHAVWTVPTRFACKNTPCIHMSMAPKLFPMFFLLLVCCALARALVCPPATPQIWTNSCRTRHRLRAYDWWLHTCTLLVMHIKLTVRCLSCEHSFPPLASGSVPNLDQYPFSMKFF